MHASSECLSAPGEAADHTNYNSTSTLQQETATEWPVSSASLQVDSREELQQGKSLICRHEYPQYFNIHRRTNPRRSVLIHSKTDLFTGTPFHSIFFLLSNKSTTLTCFLSNKRKFQAQLIFLSTRTERELRPHTVTACARIPRTKSHSSLFPRSPRFYPRFRISTGLAHLISILHLEQRSGVLRKFDVRVPNVRADVYPIGR